MQTKVLAYLRELQGMISALIKITMRGMRGWGKSSERRISPFQRLRPSPQEVERSTGLSVLIRGVRVQNDRLKGRMYRVGDTLFIEYNDINPGYFWHIDTVQHLLKLASMGMHWAQVYEHRAEGG